MSGSGLKDAIGNKVEVGSRVLLDTNFKSSIGYITEITEPSRIEKKAGLVKIICEYSVQFMREGELQGIFALRVPASDNLASYQAETTALARAKKEAGVIELPPASGNETDNPTCSHCGTLMNRSGSCYTCPNCAATSGCS